MVSIGHACLWPDRCVAISYLRWLAAVVVIQGDGRFGVAMVVHAMFVCGFWGWGLSGEGPVQLHIVAGDGGAFTITL